MIKMSRVVFGMLMVALLVFTTTVVEAAEVGLKAEYVQDFNIDQGGGRVELAINDVSDFLTPKLSVTVMEDYYNRFAIGGDFRLFTYRALTLDAVLAGVYQQTKDNDINTECGFGATAGLKATVMVNDNVGVNIGYEYFAGDGDVEDFNGGIATAGLVAKF